MGEIADMMLDGTLCEGCGVYIHGRAPGHPRRCSDCRPRNNPKPKERVRPPADQLDTDHGSDHFKPNL